MDSEPVDEIARMRVKRAKAPEEGAPGRVLQSNFQEWADFGLPAEIAHLGAMPFSLLVTAAAEALRTFERCTINDLLALGMSSKARSDRRSIIGQRVAQIARTMQAAVEELAHLLSPDLFDLPDEQLERTMHGALIIAGKMLASTALLEAGDDVGGNEAQTGSEPLPDAE